MHSGNYGNWLPDANVRLVAAAGVDGRVRPARSTIEGFYDDVLPFPPPAMKMMQEVPDDSDVDAAVVRPRLHRRRRLVAAGGLEPAERSACT